MMPRFYKLGALIGAMAIAIVVGECHGTDRGRAEGRGAGYADARRAIDDSIRRAGRSIDSVNAIVVQQSGKDSAARAAHALVRRRLAVVSDSTVAIDGGLAIPALPPLLDAIRSSDIVIRQDSIVIQAQAAKIMALEHKLVLLEERVRLDDDERAHTKPPRFGFKTGIAVGAVIGAVIAIF